MFLWNLTQNQQNYQLIKCEISTLEVWRFTLEIQHKLNKIISFKGVFFTGKYQPVSKQFQKKLEYEDWYPPKISKCLTGTPLKARKCRLSILPPSFWYRFMTVTIPALKINYRLNAALDYNGVIPSLVIHRDFRGVPVQILKPFSWKIYLLADT